MAADIAHSWAAEFPILQSWVHLDIANKCPLPRSVAAAVSSFVADAAAHPGDKDGWKAKGERLRARLAGLVGAAPAEIAFVPNTSEGLNCIAAALDLPAGSNVVTHVREHPNNLYTWLHLRRKGIDVRLAGTPDGPVRIEDLLARIDRRTRVVAVSAVSYCTGARLDMAELSAACRARGALLVVDAVQGMGVVEIDVKQLGIDVLVCGGQKGLLSLHGLGMLYCRGDVVRGLVPAYAARSSLASRAIDRDHLEFRPDAARFEAGNLNYAGIHALDAALDIILGTGVAAIQAHVLAVARALMEGLASRGVEIVTPQEDAQRAGIVVFRSAAAEATAARLRARHVIVSAIDGCVRAAPHGYTSLRQIEAFLVALDEARRC